MCPVCERLINGRGSWTGPATMVCHCLLIETAESLVLVDTGYGTHDIQDPKGRLGPIVTFTRPRLDLAETAIEQIKALGYSPRDVRHIVPTHLDVDHAGGLADFPEAQVHIFKPELQAATHPTWRERIRYRAAHFSHKPRWDVLEEQGDQWFGFNSIRAIPGLSTDVLLIPLIGHTRGHCGVAVKNGEKWVLHCGDAYFYRGTLEDPPHMPVGLAVFERLAETFGKERVANQKRLRELTRQHSDEIDMFCAHDQVEYQKCLT